MTRQGLTTGFKRPKKNSKVRGVRHFECFVGGVCKGRQCPSKPGDTPEKKKGGSS